MKRTDATRKIAHVLQIMCSRTTLVDFQIQTMRPRSPSSLHNSSTLAANADHFRLTTGQGSHRARTRRGLHRIAQTPCHKRPGDSSVRWAMNLEGEVHRTRPRMKNNKTVRGSLVFLEDHVAQHMNTILPRCSADGAAEYLR
eukprot:SAG11_NODE_51_length_19848_cov_37.780698_13_plen_142_part_00